MLEVRAAKIDDAEDLFALNTRFGNTTTIGLLKKSLVENDCEIVGIAVIDGMTVGFCSGLIIKSMCSGRDRAEIEALYVKEEYRKRGVGMALMKFLDERLTACGIQHFHINTHVDNKAAQSLYEKLEYKKNGEVLMDKTTNL